MTESGQLPVAPHSGRFRFSLRALFFFVLVAGVTFSHIVTSWRLKQVDTELADSHEELDSVKDELGRMTSEYEEIQVRLGKVIGDANQLRVVVSPFIGFGNQRWRWQVVAPDSNYRLCVAFKDIPEEGVPFHNAEVLVPRLPTGECSIEATLRRIRPGEWRLHAVCISVDSRSPAFDSVESSIEIPKSLADSLDRGGRLSISHTSNSLNPDDGPVELLRPLPFQQDLQVGKSTAQKLGEGIILWIEKDRPAPDSTLPPAPP
ncbi:MAG TPA: hypothetical protein VMV10_21550 [Pirellulales bacterium]|nr:hypothetical protein [Pirellulales bacterium]